MPIPNKLFAIWLGNLPPKDGLENMEAWQAQNKDHEMNLVIDSRLYPKPMSEEFQTKFAAFLKWGKDHNIRIRDIGNKESKEDHALYENMPCKSFYDNEVGLSKPDFCYPHEKLETNFAAASDILRVEFLYQEGGKYFDFRDMLPPTGPKAKSLKELDAKQEFLCREYGNLVINDFLASEPKGKILSAYRDSIHEKYKFLYIYPIDVRAHYQTYFHGPGLIDRRQSTLNISGPENLAKIIESEKSPVYFDKDNYSLLDSPGTEAGQIHDWYKLDDAKHYQEIVRNYARFYLRDSLIKLFPNVLFSKISTAPEELNNLLFSFPLDWNMTQMVEACKKHTYQHSWSQDEHDKLNSFLTEFAIFSERLEFFLKYLEEMTDAPADHLISAVKTVRESYSFTLYSPPKKDFKDLFDALIIENQGKPSIETMQEFMPYLELKPMKKDTPQFGS